VSEPPKLKFIPVTLILKLPSPGVVAILPPVITMGTASAVEAEHKSRKGRKNKKARVLDGPLKVDEVRRGKGRMSVVLLKSIMQGVRGIAGAAIRRGTENRDVEPAAQRFSLTP
jgi:hypothetical protein